jgi:hypothetical protein
MHLVETKGKERKNKKTQSHIKKTLFLHSCYLAVGWVLVIDKNPKGWVVAFEGNIFRVSYYFLFYKKTEIP